MSFVTIEKVLDAAVATAGTFTVGYPTGYQKADFVNGNGHLLIALNALFRCPGDFTVSLGDSTATITYNGATTIPVASTVRVQLDVLGNRDSIDQMLVGAKQVQPAPFMMLNLGTPDTADADGILDGVSATDSAAAYDSDDFVTAFTGTLDVPRNLTATGTAGSDHVVTVTGTDVYGDTLVEALTLSGTSVIAGKKAFKTVSAIAVAAGAAGDTFDLGWGDVLGLPVHVPDAGYVLAEVKNGVALPRKPGVEYLYWQYGATQINAGTAWELVSPCAGNITKLRSTIQIAFTTGGDVTVEVNTTAVDGLSMAVGTDAAGVRDEDTPTAGHATTRVAAGDRIEIIGSAAFDSAGALNGVLEIELTPADQLDGTFVAGLDTSTKSTATTADVRGTYDPADAADGSTSWALLVAVPDPAFRGVPQFAG